MKQKLLKLIKKNVTAKRKGFGDLFVSLVVLVALTLVVLIYVCSIGDIQTKIMVDQIARKYILRMETTGNLTDTDRNAMIAELNNITAIKKAGGVSASNITANPTTASYGQSISLTIDCKAMMTNWSWTPNEVFGKIERTKETQIIVRKQSTAKY